ncbi:hypothetical protein E4U44_006241 [Claviceps purpurea]|nr:hypothetical protein E4U44_006241 [Claviceps purpurea]
MTSTGLVADPQTDLSGSALSNCPRYPNVARAVSCSELLTVKISLERPEERLFDSSGAIAITTSHRI